MTTPKKIVACLDIRGGKVVKGINFQGIKEVGDPLTRAKLYCEAGADELCFYDISASVEGRILFTELLSDIVKAVSVPVSAAGGVKTVDDFARVLDAGVSKVSLNSGALADPALVAACARRFGSDKVVLAIDAARVGDAWHCFNQAGANDTGVDALAWLKRCEQDGAGEFVINSIDTDGVQDGYDLVLLKTVCDQVSLPVVASGGAGKLEDIVSLFQQVPKCAAALGASIFHYDLVDIGALKRRLKEENIPVCER